MSSDALQTALLSDAAGRPIAMAGGIRSVWRGARLAGPALTVRTDPGEHRSTQVVQPGERKLHLRFDTDGTGHPETGRLFDQML